MKARQLPARTHKAKLIQPVGEVLPSGLTGWVVANQERTQMRDNQDVPDYIFRPDVNPELSFFVFDTEIELLD